MNRHLLPPPQDPSRSGFVRAAERVAVAPTARPEALDEVVRLVGLASASAGQFDFRLRPILRELAAHRLRLGHGVDLGTQPSAARALLGDELFNIVGTEHPRPEDRSASGPSVEEITGFVDRLEHL